MRFSAVLLPGVPAPADVERVFEVLVDDGALLKAARIVGEAQPLLPLTGGRLASNVESGKYFFQVAGADEYPFVTIRFSAHPSLAGRISGYLVHDDVDLVMNKLHELLEVVEAPVTIVQDRAPGKVVDPRISEARDAVKKKMDGPVGFNWKHYLLAGVGYRTVLSDQVVDFIGSERIAALPDDVAWTEQGRQFLAGSHSLTSLPPDDFDESEYRLLESLDAFDKFYNPETGEPPTEIPTLSHTRDVRFANKDGALELGTL